VGEEFVSSPERELERVGVAEKERGAGREAGGTGGSCRTNLRVEDFAVGGEDGGGAWRARRMKITFPSARHKA